MSQTSTCVRQPRTPAAGPFDPDAIDHTELRRPLDELGEAAGRGRDRDRAQFAAEMVQRGSDMGVGVGVDPERDQ
jgi:hypothetical protein